MEEQQLVEAYVGSVQDLRAVIAKDTDFVNSFLLSSRPYKLLLISTGNIADADLEDLFVARIPAITAAFESCDYLELTWTTQIFHS